MLAQHGIIQSINRASKILDTYTGAAAAYSLRKLRTAYSGSAIRVRRSSDNTESNIGFTGSGVLDESALTSFVGANSGFVTTFYDQSGGSINLTQATASLQPIIVSSGALIVVNGNPAIEFPDSNLPSLYYTGSTPNLYLFAVAKLDISSSFNTLVQFGADASGDTGTMRIEGGGSNYYRCPSTNENFGDYANSTGHIYFNNVLHSTGQSVLSQHIIAAKRGTTIVNDGIVLGTSFTTRGYRGKVQELILYTADQSSNRTGIETNINTHYSIY